MNIDEDTFLAALLPRLATDDSIVVSAGDDCAAIQWTDDRLLLLAVDQVAAGIHYLQDCDPALAGRKLLARNLSDIAAMGGRPMYALLALAVQQDCDAAWAEAFVDGVLELADACGVKLIGGDVCAAGSAVASLTIVGDVATGAVCRRSGASAGDRLLVTGCFGGSLPTGHHFHFTPRTAEGQWLAAHGVVAAMIDVSDGLLKDLGRLCAASGVGAVVDEAAIPLTCIDNKPVDLSAAWLDGEDYELLLAVPAGDAAGLLQDWPFETVLSEIGEFVAASSIPLVDSNGRDLAGHYGLPFNHFTRGR